MEHCKKLSSVVFPLAAVLASSSTNAEVLYDKTQMTENLTYVSARGVGLYCLSGFCADLGIADDFAIAAPYSIEYLTADCGSSFGQPMSEISVRIYADEGGSPSESALHSFLASFDDETISASPIPNTLFVWASEENVDGYRYTIDLTSANIQLEAGTWWVSFSPRAGTDTAAILRNASQHTGTEFHVRDEDPTTFLQPFGSFTWIPFSQSDVYDNEPVGDIAIRIEGSPTVAGCPCEYTNDALVDFFDLLAFLDLWFASAPAADINQDTLVDFFDLLDFLDCWFTPDQSLCN